MNLFRYVVFTVFGLFFLLPLLAMIRFSLEGSTGGSWSLSSWGQIASYAGPPPLLSGVEITLEIAVITCLVVLVLLVPTVIWVRLRVRWMTRLIEALCLLPLTIPAIVLVVGLAPIYRVIRQQFSLSALQLFWVYAILALPYAYRALAAGLDGVDVKTLSEAARSLGAGWTTVIWRVIVPNMRQGVLNAMLSPAPWCSASSPSRTCCCTTTFRSRCSSSAAARPTRACCSPRQAPHCCSPSCCC